MNFYAGSALVAFFFTISVGAIAWLKAPEKTQGRFFGLVSLSISLWVLGCFGESFATEKWALFF